MSYEKTQTVDETQKILGRLELDILIRWQINRCNTSIENPLEFGLNVEILKMNMPKTRRDRVDELANLYTYEVEEYVYKYTKGGRPLGSPENPFYINNEEDPNHDPTKPEILVSPKKMKIKKVDYNKLYTIILDQLEESGLTWKNQEYTTMVGALNDTVEEPQ
jgi:hypothetical protein